MRRALLIGLAATWLGALATWPAYAVMALAAWSAVARATDRTVTRLVVRRYAHGRRPSDVPWAVILSPLHLLIGAIATVVSMILPALVGLAGVFAAALLLSGSSGTEVRPGAPITVLVGGILALLMLWTGPGGASLRRGSRSIVRRVVPDGPPSEVLAVVLTVVGIALAYMAISGSSSVSWAPLSGNPFGS
ncbi:hypothetical protein N865_04135 [Intrasporangium oryzae NRRL B-24470]|uniref:Uncharacterized protein n=1 Tax=Intrasporangium oryzae NRRL B-24470 TaxID=1386089 RepID=W9GBY5_9MICO|nr:hypothetical protein N865_04135 [Intrasporangium oryzae NRRL B-24470]